MQAMQFSALFLHEFFLNWNLSHLVIYLKAISFSWQCKFTILILATVYPIVSRFKQKAPVISIEITNGDKNIPETTNIGPQRSEIEDKALLITGRLLLD